MLTRGRGSSLVGSRMSDDTMAVVAIIMANTNVQRGVREYQAHRHALRFGTRLLCRYGAVAGAFEVRHIGSAGALFCAPTLRRGACSGARCHRACVGTRARACRRPRPCSGCR